MFFIGYTKKGRAVNAVTIENLMKKALPNIE